MLVGNIIFKGHKYKVSGVDNSTTMSLLIKSNNYDAINYMVNPECEDTNDALWERRFDINMSNVKVSTAVNVVNGKKVKSRVNADLFCRLGSLIRYAKKNCLKRYQEGYSGLILASGEFEPNVKAKYFIPFPTDKDKTLATVVLLYDSIVELHLETSDVKIDIVEDSYEAQILLPAIKDGWQSGIAFNKDYLGFEVPTQTVEAIRGNNGMYTSIEEIIGAHPDKEFSWLLKKDYRIVTDETLEEVCNYIMNWDGYVYYDTETTGLNINFKSRLGQADQCVGIVLSVKYGESFYFPMQMKSIKNLCNGDHFYFMEHYMRPILEGKKLVAHNMSFDWKVGYIYDINCNIVHDTMALIKLTIGAEQENYPMGLKDNAKILLNRDSLELSDLIIGGSWGESDDIKFWDLPEELVRLYACADTDNTNGLLGYAEQADLLNKYNARKVYEIEIAFSLAVAYQEFYGHRIDIQNLDKIREEIGKGQDDCMAEMVKICGHEFNPNSPRDLVNILYHELGIPEQISRKTGRPTTDKETLKKLSEITDAEDNVKYPFCLWLQKYREYEGVRKIVDKFPEHVTEDGYVFSSVMQYGTTTGRVSINKPNYQSYNDPIKKNVIPRPGYWMFDTDYSSVEYRVLGNMVGNERIKENFKDPDFDYHAYQAAHMYGVPYSAVTKTLRKAAKGINFGLPYGMGDESLGIRVFGEASPENTRKAAALRSAYFKGQEDIHDWFEYHRDRGVNEGFTETYFGRRRYYHKSKFSEGAIRRQAGNQVIQGCLDGSTIIEVKGIGAVPIKNMVNTHVQVWNGHDWTWGDVLYSGKKQKCIITFTNGQRFICSPIHRFKVVRDTIYSYADVNPDWEEDIKNDGHIGGLFTRCKHLKKGVVIEINTDTSKHCIKDFETARFIEKECIGSCDDDSGDTYVYKNTLECVEVESVEITDEWIDMYDVCNTDCGYYVADGIITHNTAADIYKTAVGRVFKRICKEGLLGKVMLTGFIHDELLGEVSNDINPAVWLKILREEFEVKIFNEDGTPWSPLYMGFGYGTSWYEAKSVELPIKLQWEIVDNYGETGFPQWDGNARKFCDSVPDMLRDFNVRDVRNQLLDLDSQGKEIKPTLNKQLFGVLKEDIKVYSDTLSDYIQCGDYQECAEMGEANYLNTYHNALCEYLDEKCHIQELHKNADGDYTIDTPEMPKNTQDAITLYCELHGVDRNQVNLLDIPEVGEAEVNNYESVNYFYEDDEVDSEEKRQRIIDTRVDTLGMYLDVDNKMVILRMLPKNYMDLIQSKVNREGIGYKIRFKDCTANKLYDCEAWLTSQDINFIQQIYLTYFNSL